MVISRTTFFAVASQIFGSLMLVLLAARTGDDDYWFYVMLYLVAMMVVYLLATVWSSYSDAKRLRDEAKA
jgi:uncharacterized membrane protein